MTEILDKNSRWQHIAILIGIFLLAVLPRLTYKTLITYDETLFWLDRTEQFHTAISEGDWANTLVAYHPGVVTTWLSSAGLTLDHALYGMDHRETNLLQFIAIIRIPIAIFHSLCIVFAYVLLRRLLNVRIALLGCIFWALNPFVIAHSQIIHTDGPVASLSILAFLTALVAFKLDQHLDIDNPIRWRWIILSGVLGALALLAKVNGIFVTIAIAGVVMNMRILRAENRLLMFRKAIQAGILWVLAFIITCFVVWPVMWVDLSLILNDSVGRSAEIALSGHPNFYLGTVTGYPALHFFFVAQIIRSTPWEIIGLVLGLYFIIKNSKRRESQIMTSLVFFVLVTLVIISFQPKKFDRYALPIYPFIDIIAAFGWFILSEKVIIRLRKRNPNLLVSINSRRAVWLIVTACMALFTLSYAPYYLDYYNPLTGGIRTATRLILVGWGEGMESAAEFIQSDSDDVCNTRIVASMGEYILQPLMPCTVVETLDDADLIPEGLTDDDYVVLYINHIQRYAPTTEAIRRYLEYGELIHTVRIDGVNMVYIYQGTPPEEVNTDIRAYYDYTADRP